MNYFLAYGTINKQTKFINFKEFYLKKGFPINANDYMINLTLNEEIDGLYAWKREDISYLPISMYRKLPKLVNIRVFYSSLKIIMVLNLKNLTYLKTLYLSGNQIESIEEKSFDGLQSLEILKLDKNKLVEIPSNAFKKTIMLSEINFKHNLIMSLQNDIFVNLKGLEIINFDFNNITQIFCSFKNNFRLQSVSFFKNPVKLIGVNLIRLPSYYKMSHLNFKGNFSCINECYGNSYYSYQKCLPRGKEGMRHMIDALKKCT